MIIIGQTLMFSFDEIRITGEFHARKSPWTNTTYIDKWNAETNSTANKQLLYQWWIRLLWRLVTRLSDYFSWQDSHNKKSTIFYDESHPSDVSYVSWVIFSEKLRLRNYGRLWGLKSRNFKCRTHKWQTLVGSASINPGIMKNQLIFSNLF